MTEVVKCFLETFDHLFLSGDDDFFVKMKVFSMREAYLVKINKKVYIFFTASIAKIVLLTHAK